LPTACGMWRSTGCGSWMARTTRPIPDYFHFDFDKELQMSILTMGELNLAGKRVLIREDLNVPVKNGQVDSDDRIVASLPTVRLALEKGAAVMVCSHLGRPEEGVFSEENSLAPVADYLSKALGREVLLVRDYLNGVEVQPGQVVLLENVRFNT